MKLREIPVKLATGEFSVAQAEAFLGHIDAIPTSNGRSSSH